MLAKGPLGLLLPGLVLTLWHGSRREWRRLFELAPLALISFAVYLPWFVACAHAMGSDNILYELYAQNFARFFSGPEVMDSRSTTTWSRSGSICCPGDRCCPSRSGGPSAPVVTSNPTRSSCSGGSARSWSFSRWRSPSVSSTCCRPTRPRRCSWHRGSPDSPDEAASLQIHRHRVRSGSTSRSWSPFWQSSPWPFSSWRWSSNRSSPRWT